MLWRRRSDNDRKRKPLVSTYSIPEEIQLEIYDMFKPLTISVYVHDYLSFIMNRIQQNHKGFQKCLSTFMIDNFGKEVYDDRLI